MLFCSVSPKCSFTSHSRMAPKPDAFPSRMEEKVHWREGLNLEECKVHDNWHMTNDATKILVTTRKPYMFQGEWKQTETQAYGDTIAITDTQTDRQTDWRPCKLTTMYIFYRHYVLIVTWCSIAAQLPWAKILPDPDVGCSLTHTFKWKRWTNLRRIFSTRCSTWNARVSIH